MSEEVLDYDREEEIRPQQVEAPPKTVIDHQGLKTSEDVEPQEEVLYEIKETPSFHVTRALFIANLRKPINAMNFQNYLKELAENGGGHKVERAWLNRTRTHGIVLIDNEEGATYIRDKLLGSLYPPEEEEVKLKDEFEMVEEERYEIELKQYEQEVERLGSDQELKPPAAPKKFFVERHPLYVDFIPVKAINQWVYEEDRGPRNGKWKIDYETRGDEVIASHTLLNGDFVPRLPPRFSGRGRGRGRGIPRGGRGGNRYNQPPPYRGGYGYAPRPYYPRNDGYSQRPARYETDSYVPAPRENGTDSYVPARSSDRLLRTDTYTPASYRGDRYDGRARSRSRSPNRQYE